MSQKLISLLFFISIPTIILAHGSHGSGIMAGFTHPIFGVDHHVAILGSGFLGYILDQRKWYLLPIAFISAMVLGGFLGVNQEATQIIEKAIAFSVFTIGVFSAFRMRFNFLLILILLLVFGFFHGYAHGAEMPESNTVYKYIPGYTLGAILLALIGVFIGKMIMTKDQHNSTITLISGIIIGCGIMMLLP